MPICAEIDYLFALKNIDEKFFHYFGEIEKIENEVRRYKFKLSELNELLKSADSYIKDLKLQEKMFLLKQDDCGIKLNIIKNKINSVKNNKEYKALLKEQDLCLSLNNKIDNEILAIMEKVEQLNSEIKNMESKFEDINKKLKIVDSEKKNISDDFRNKKSKLLILRDKIVSKILPRHFEKYEFKMKKMNRPPLFEISGEICPFCGFEISQALKNSIVSLDGINLCNECGVILYWAGASESRKCDFCAKFVDTEDLIDAIISEKKFVCSRCKNETDIFKG